MSAPLARLPIDYAALCRRARAGDRAALDVLLEEARIAVWPMCYRGASGVTVDAEDLLQEAMVRAISGIEAYDATRPFIAWVVGIAAHVVANRHRDRARTQAIADVEPVAPALPAPMADDLARLNGALAQLDPLTRSIVLLRHTEDFSWDEIARLVGMTRDAVKKRLVRGRAELRAMLDGGSP